MAHQSTACVGLKDDAPRQASSQKRWIRAIPIAIVALLGAAAFWHFFPAWTGANAAAASLRADFSLDLQRAGTDYRVAWDPNSPAVLAAKRGTLFIKDGSFQQQLQLDRDQLASAGVVYSPATTDVSFRLELFGGPEPAVSSVRLLAGFTPQVAAVATEAPAPEPALPVATATPAPEEQPPEESADQPPAPDAPATMAAAPKPEDIPVPAR